MNQPLGPALGNGVELGEVMQVLGEGKEGRWRELTLQLGGELLCANRLFKSFAAATREGDEGAGAFVPIVPTMCPGCGVGLQAEDKNAPGFFVMPKRAFEQPSDEDDEEDEEDDDDAFIAGMMDDEEDDDDIDEDFIPDGFELDENYVEADDAEARLDALNALFDSDDSDDDYASARRADRSNAL